MPVGHLIEGYSPTELMDGRVMAHKQLLIIGNGFDLQCGLHSSFYDFEKPRLAKLEEGKKLESEKRLPSVDTLGPYGQVLSGSSPEFWFRKQNFSLWDLILLDDRRTHTWFDVEASIQNRVSNKIEDNREPIDGGAPVIDLRPYSITAAPFWDCDIDTCIKEYANELYGWDGSWNMLLDILLKELHLYEQEFTQYMTDQINQTTDYQHKAIKLIQDLANDSPKPAKLDREIAIIPDDKEVCIRYNPDTMRFDNQPEKVTILDFNYSNPLSGITDTEPMSVNIHGNLKERNVIFGIDGTNLDTDIPDYEEVSKFTKTYRLMQLRSAGYAPLVYPPDSNHEGVETGTIKFYGHSLGSADYAYFQSIFDTIDLYGSRTHLIFYYHDPKHAQDMYGKVNRLINTYGKTLDNKDHGKNLLHKLLLEGRLNVLQAPIDETASVS